MSIGRTAPALMLALALAGCENEDEPFQKAWVLLPPVALESTAAYVERTNATVFLLDPADPALRPAAVRIGADPVLAVRRNGHDELLVLTQGAPSQPGVVPEEATLTVVPGARGQAGAPRELTLPARFNTLAQSPDGRFVVAFFAPGTTQTPGAALFNPNEIAVLDLDAPPGTSAVARTVRSFGGVPLAVAFSPQLSLPDGMRSLAVVLSDNYVTLLDLDNPARSEITVPLTLTTDIRNRRPTQVLFETSSHEPAIYVRADGTEDIYVLRLTAAAERAPGANDFTPSLSQLTAGVLPLDMALVGDPEDPRLLVLAASGDAWIFNARTSQQTRVSLAEPGVASQAAPNRIFLFEGQSPAEPKARPRALLLGENTGRRNVTFVDLDGIEEQRTKNLDLRPMGAAVARTHFFPAQGVALVEHAPGSGSTGFSVIDLVRRTVAPIVASIALGGIHVGPADPGGPARMWIAPAAGMSGLDTHLSFLDLDSFSPGDVRLDARIGGVMPFARDTDGKLRVLVDHGSATGHVTIVDGDAPDRATARTARGFLLNDLLQREVQ